MLIQQQYKIENKEEKVGTKWMRISQLVQLNFC